MQIEMREKGADVRREVLTLGNYRQTLSAVRSLRRAGYATIVGFSSDDETYPRRSRYTSRLWQHPPFSRPDQFVASLREFIIEHPGILVFPIGDSIAELAAKRRAEFGPARFCAPQPEVVLKCLDKGRMSKIAATAGLRVPRTVGVRSLAELQAARTQIALPWAVKPRDSLLPGLMRKALFIETAADIRRYFPVWPQGMQELLVQRKIGGLRYNVDFAADAGTILASCHTKVLRVDSCDYSGVAVDTVSIPFIDKLARYSAAIVKALDYTGIGLLQFLHDPGDDDFYFLELNPRLGAPVAGACYSGLDVPAWAAALAAPPEERRLPEPREIRAGMRCNWLHGDLVGLLHALNTGQVRPLQGTKWLLKLSASFLHADCHSTWDLRDPVPTVTALSSLGASVVRHLLKGRTAVAFRPRAKA